jgi:hypothetical protein
MSTVVCFPQHLTTPRLKHIAATRLMNGFGDSCNFCQRPATGHCTSCHSLVCHGDLLRLGANAYDSEKALCPECVVDEYGVCEQCNSGQLALANCFECDRDLCLNCAVRCDDPGCAHIDYCPDCWEKRVPPCSSCNVKRCQFAEMNDCVTCGEPICAQCEQHCCANIECTGDDYYCTECVEDALVLCDAYNCLVRECINCVHQCAGCDMVLCVGHADEQFVYCDPDDVAHCLCNSHYCAGCYEQHLYAITATK